MIFLTNFNFNFKQIYQMKSEDASTYYRRGLAQFRIGNYEAAIKDYDRAIELVPYNAKAYYKDLIFLY